MKAFNLVSIMDFKWKSCWFWHLLLVISRLKPGPWTEFMPSNRNCSSTETAGGGRGGRIKQKLILGVGSNGDCVPALGPQVWWIVITRPGMKLNSLYRISQSDGDFSKKNWSVNPVLRYLWRAVHRDMARNYHIMYPDTSDPQNWHSSRCVH